MSVEADGFLEHLPVRLIQIRGMLSFQPYNVARSMLWMELREGLGGNE